MEVKFFENNRTIDIELFHYSDARVFKLIASELTEKFNVQWKEKVDGFDQRYWDFEMKGIKLTLHLEHFLGIMIFANKANPQIEEATQILLELKEHFSHWNPPKEMDK
jgi:hypothetical protein